MMDFVVGDVVRLNDGGIYEIVKMISCNNTSYLLVNVENGMDLSIVKVKKVDDKTAFLPLSDSEYMDVLRKLIA